ncbi:hypothetical protein ACS0TY_012407 [Phlomoides rotata]
MKPSRILAFTKPWIFLFIILLSTSNSESQSEVSSCISHCDTCPVVCSPAPSPPAPPPPRKKHHSPPPPAVNEYTPAAPGMVQQNFSYPYYYFYTSGAADKCSPLHHAFIIFMLFQVLYQLK